MKTLSYSQATSLNLEMDISKNQLRQISPHFQLTLNKMYRTTCKTSLIFHVMVHNSTRLITFQQLTSNRFNVLINYKVTFKHIKYSQEITKILQPNSKHSAKKKYSTWRSKYKFIKNRYKKIRMIYKGNKKKSRKSRISQRNKKNVINKWCRKTNS